jgi:hypothetical protein
MGAALVVAGAHGDLTGSPTPAAAVAVASAHTYQPPAARRAPTPAATSVTVHAAPTSRPATRPGHSRSRASRAPAPARHLPARHVSARHHHATATTYRAALANAIARIPTYRSGTVRWEISRAYAFWGTADWYHAVLYVSPDVPRSKLYDVAVHEWSHELSVLDYAGDVARATDAMNGWFGGSGLTGAERAADCMSILQGATWTHYTTCTNAHWRAGARLLVAGQRL